MKELEDENEMLKEKVQILEESSTVSLNRFRIVLVLYISRPFLLCLVFVVEFVVSLAECGRSCQ